MADLVELQRPKRALREPAVIAGFTVARRAGRLPSRTVLHLVDAWKAELLARTDMEDLYDQRIIRPYVRYVDGERVFDWPQAHVYLAEESSGRDVLLLVAQEPNFHWRRFCETLTAYLDGLGARTLITLRAFPGYVPHTRPAPVMLNGPDRELAVVYGAQVSGAYYEGPTDVGGVLAARADELGWQTVDLSVLQPYYFPRMPNFRASLDLIAALDRGLGRSTSLPELEEAAATQARAVDAQVEASLEMRRIVAELEQRYDAGFQFQRAAQAGGESALPTTEEVLSEIEKLLGRGEGRQGE